MAIKHDAFISYNHHLDHPLAKALEDGMERLAKPLLALRAIDVFRDETALAANPDLWARIVDHLSGTAWLIVLACPEWAASPWCGQEVKWWLDNRSTDRMLIAVVSGDVVWDRAHGDFDWTATTALHGSLSGRFASEPLYVDLRWARGVDGLSLRNLQFRDAVLSLSATIRGIAKDSLDGEDVRQLRRTRRLVRAGVTAIVIAAAVAVWQAFVAIAERDTARSRELAAQAQLQLADEEAFPRLPALLALESQRIEDNAVANQSLQTSLGRLPPPHVSTMTVGRQRKIAAPGFSPDARYLAFVSEGQLAGTPTKVELWDVAAGRQVATWEVDEADTALSFSADGRYLAFAGKDNAVTIVDVETHKPVRQVHAFNRSWAWADGALHLLAAGPQPNVLRVVDGIADREIATITAPGAIAEVVISADGKLVVATSTDGKLATWRIANGAAVPAWQIATRADVPVLSADGSKLAAVVADDAVAVFDAETGKTLERITGGNEVKGAIFSPAAQYVQVVEAPGRIRVFDLMLHKPILVVGGRTNELTANDMIDVTQRSPIVDVSFARGDRFFIAVRSDGVVMRFARGATAGFGTFGVNLLDHAETLRVSAGPNLHEAAISPDGRYLITGVGGTAMNASATMDLANYKTRVWDLSDGREVARITSDRGVGFVAASPDGRLFATLGLAAVMDEKSSRAVPLVELQAWRLTDTIGAGVSVAPAPDDAALGEMIRGILSLDGRHAATIKDAQVTLWDADHSVRKLALPDPVPAGGPSAMNAPERALRFSDDGAVLIAAAGRSVFAIRTSDGGLVGRKDLDGDIAAIVLDRVGRHAAAALFHPELVKPEQMLGETLPRGALVTRIWQVADGADVTTIEHTTHANVMALSRDGRTAAFVTVQINRDDIVAISKQLRGPVPLRTTLQFWDVARGRARGTPTEADDFVGLAAFSDDGNTLITVDLPMVWAAPGPTTFGRASFGVWDAWSGRQIAAPHLPVPNALADLIPHGPPYTPMFGEHPWGAAFGLSPDGHAVMVTEHVLGAGAPARITTRRILWQTADLVRLVCDRLPAGQRALTAEEVRRLIPGERYRPACPP
jgi:WD40 repeat protein